MEDLTASVDRGEVPQTKQAPSATNAPNAPNAQGGPDESGSQAPEDLEGLWKDFQDAFRSRIHREQFETWFRRAVLTRADSGIVRISVQNGFTRNWLREHYARELDQSICEVFGGPRALEIDVDPERLASEKQSAEDTRAARDAASAQAPTRGALPNGRSDARGDRRSDLRGDRTQSNGHALSANGTANRLLWDSDVTLNAKYRFDTFVVGPCNRFAHAAALGVSESPGKYYNPFFLHGSVGLGKTHLLQSLCHTILDREPGTRILYLSCETFVNHFISALENADLPEFRNKYRNVDLLVVDDIHLLANKERTQEEFFHTFNTLYNAGKQIVLSSDSSPKEIPTLQNRLVSRFKWGLVTEIETPCYETRMAILKRKSRERGRELDDAVARLLAEHIDTNIRELEGAVTRLIGFASLAGQPITTDLARKVLRDVFEVRRGQPSMDDIIRLITQHFNVKLSELQSRKRTSAIAHPRQVAMYLARKITRHSLEEIGGFFGGRDHSTVLYAVDKIDGLDKREDRFRELVASFMKDLEQ